MKEEKVVTKEYVINGFKHFSQLAMEYFPAHSGYSAARKSMRDKIEAANYTDHTITLSPKMQQIIWAYWGPPSISLPESCPNIPNCTHTDRL